MKSIDVNHLYWFDRINGNTYFACEVTVDLNQPTEQRFNLPFQYGYGNHFEAIVKEELVKRGLIPAGDPWVYIGRWCRENGVEYRETSRKALKREVKAIK